MWKVDTRAFKNDSKFGWGYLAPSDDLFEDLSFGEEYHLILIKLVTSCEEKQVNLPHWFRNLLVILSVAYMRWGITRAFGAMV